LISKDHDEKSWICESSSKTFVDSNGIKGLLELASDAATMSRGLAVEQLRGNVCETADVSEFFFEDIYACAVEQSSCIVAIICQNVTDGFWWSLVFISTLLK
jgi:hypothetical protein